MAPVLSVSELALQLYQRQLIKFGNFTLHSGQVSLVYFDLRNLIVDPAFFSQVIDLYLEVLGGIESTFDFIAGPAYTGIPIATLLSQRLNKPMILIRKEAKTHGTGSGSQITSGGFDASFNRVLIVDDVITSGASLFDTAKLLRDAGFTPVNFLVLIDRRPIIQRTCEVMAVFSVEAVLKELINVSDFSGELKKQILAKSEWFPSFTQRLEFNLNPGVRKLLTIMAEKQSRLVLSADSSDPVYILNLIDTLGPEIAVLKIHSDILVFNSDFPEKWFYDNLKQMSQQYRFLILEDRKLADIGSTTVMQLKRISTWADLVTAHIISGPGIIQAAREVPGIGLLLIAEMSSQDNLITSNYTRMAVRMAQANPEVVAGLICQSRLLDARFLHFTPGVKLLSGNGMEIGSESSGNETSGDQLGIGASDQLGIEASDQLGQRYRTPAMIDTDLFIVGRGILEATDVLKKAREYRLNFN